VSSDSPDIKEALLSSPSLYLGDVRVTENTTAASSSLRSGRRIKELLLPTFFWFLRSAPAPLAMLPFRLVQGLAWLLYPVPGNALRQSCQYICRIAARAGHDHQPGFIYRQFLRNVVAVASGYRQLLRNGADSASVLIDYREEDMAHTHLQIKERGGALVLCPHNLGAVFSAVKLNELLPFVVVYRNSATIRRTQLALDIIERMRLKILMVRGSNPFELSRAMFSALKDHRVVAATVDNVHPGDGGVEADIFGMKVSFAGWAAKIATKKKAPVIPSYYHSVGDRISVVFGEALVTDDMQQAVQHYVSFFEQSILEDPASWAYLGDRKWRRVLRKAAAKLD